MPGDFLSFDQDTALVCPAEEFGHEGIEATAQCGLAGPSMPHDHNKRSIFNLGLNVLQGRSFVSLIGERQVFN